MSEKQETPIGNVANLREAAKYVQSTMEGLRDPTDKNNAEFIRIWEIVSAALATPPRNCDVGTSEEQEKRHEAFCDATRNGMAGYHCDDAPRCVFCFSKWAQMPYEPKEGSKE